MNKRIVLALCVLISINAAAQSSSPAVRYSQSLLISIRDNQPVDRILADIAALPAADIPVQLNNDVRRKAFWINMYNAFVQLKLNGYAQPKIAKKFYKSATPLIAGKTYTLNQMEALLRPGTGQLDSMDYRIHFALNKGTASSPAIIVYDDNNLEEQLTQTTKAYLKQFVKMDEDGEEVEFPKLLKSKRADFGGKEHLLQILRNNEVIFMNVTPRRIEYYRDDNTVKAKNFYQSPK